MEKCLSKMGVAASTSAVAVDDTLSSEDSDDDSWSERKSRRARGKRNLKSGKR